MSDTGRQSLSDKMTSSMKPDSQKGNLEQAGDYIKGKMDSGASTMQPNSEKSTTQRMGDSVSDNSNEDQESLMDKAKNVVGIGGDRNSAL